MSKEHKQVEFIQGVAVSQPMNYQIIKIEKEPWYTPPHEVAFILTYWLFIAGMAAVIGVAIKIAMTIIKFINQ